MTQAKLLEPAHVGTPTPPPAPAAAPARPAFTAEEWAALRRDDKRAGAAIIIIMGTIFTIGLAMYVAICLAVSG